MGIQGAIFTFLQSLLDACFHSTFYVVYNMYNIQPSMACVEEIERGITVWIEGLYLLLQHFWVSVPFFVP